MYACNITSRNPQEYSLNLKYHLCSPKSTDVTYHIRIWIQHPLERVYSAEIWSATMKNIISLPKRCVKQVRYLHAKTVHYRVLFLMLFILVAQKFRVNIFLQMLYGLRFYAFEFLRPQRVFPPGLKTAINRCSVCT